MKGMPFNTDMVRALLDGRKTVTRRVVKGYALDHLELDTDGSIIGVYDQDEGFVFPVTDYAPYRPGDILYVRETWAHPSKAEIDNGADPGMYLYKADTVQPAAWDKWRRSIYMPREAARLFLRVTDVRVERLHDICIEDTLKEGVSPTYRPGSCRCQWYFDGCMKSSCANRDAYEWECHVYPFAKMWNSTVKPADRALCGWEANPWVWVIEFERIGKEAAERRTA